MDIQNNLLIDVEVKSVPKKIGNQKSTKNLAINLKTPRNMPTLSIVDSDNSVLMT